MLARIAYVHQDRRKGLEKLSSISDGPAVTVLPCAGLLAVILACANAADGAASAIRAASAAVLMRFIRCCPWNSTHGP